MTDTTPRTFALIGAAGYIAPRHMRAIRETGNRRRGGARSQRSRRHHRQLFPRRAIFSPSSSASTATSTSCGAQPTASRSTTSAICSPNYLHDSHIRFALRIRRRRDLREAAGAQPVEPRRAGGDRARHRAQDQHHPAAAAASRDHRPARTQRLRGSGDTKARSRSDVHHFARAAGTMHSWKGDERKSGGIATNIGVHFFDMLHFLFGELQDNMVHPERADQRRRAISSTNVRACAGSCRSTQDDVPEPRARRAASGPTARSPSTARRSSSPAASPTCTPAATRNTRRATASVSRTTARRSKTVAAIRGAGRSRASAGEAHPFALGVDDDQRLHP